MSRKPTDKPPDGKGEVHHLSAMRGHKSRQRAHENPISIEQFKREFQEAADVLCGLILASDLREIKNDLTHLKIKISDEDVELFSKVAIANVLEMTQGLVSQEGDQSLTAADIAFMNPRHGGLYLLQRLSTMLADPISNQFPANSNKSPYQILELTTALLQREFMRAEIMSGKNLLIYNFFRQAAFSFMRATVKHLAQNKEFNVSVGAIEEARQQGKVAIAPVGTSSKDSYIF